MRRIETHAAAVFLAGERAYKVKRAVRFPFLDYSTLAQRKAACDAELAVNRLSAPEIYLRVVAITRAHGRLALGGSGEPVEWAVEMRRFDESATLDRLADRGKIDASLANALARAVVLAHARAPLAGAEPWIEMLARVIAQNDTEFRETPEIFPESAAAALARECSAALDRVRPLLRARGAQGLVRRGHGDLHLGNIALIGGRPVLFDAIEFDPLIASGDVLHDLAFLLMDLSERGLRQAANILLNRYLVEAGRDSNLDALAALPLFMSVRAAIRAKVTAARLENVSATERAAITARAQSYFQFARDLITPPAPRLIAIGGLSGTGKSALARALAPDLLPIPGAVLLRSDIERKILFGVGETARLPPEAYSAETTRKVYATLAGNARRILAAGHSAIVDAVFAAPEERAAIAEIGGPHFQGLFLIADIDTRLARVRNRSGDASEADARIARQQDSYDLGAMEWTKIDASGTPEGTLQRVRGALAW